MAQNDKESALAPVDNDSRMPKNASTGKRDTKATHANASLANEADNNDTKTGASATPTTSNSGSAPALAPAPDNATAGGHALPNDWLARVAFIWSGYAVSAFLGNAASYSGIWFVTESTESPLALAALYVLAFLPMGILSPLGGVIADKYNRKTIIVTCNSVLAVAGIACAWFNAPLMTLLQKGIPEEKLGRVMGLFTAMNGLAIPVGTALGGIIAEGVGTPLFFCVDGAFIIALGIATILPKCVRALN